MVLLRRLRVPVLCAAPLLACAVDGDDGQLTFGGPTSQAATTFTTTTMTSTTLDPSSSTTDDVSSSGGDASSTGGEEESEGSDTVASADTTGGPNEQPENGMYSECTDVTDCVGQNFCVVVEVGNGFCSTTPCAVPGDCDPTPGGTATPACVDVMVGMNMSTACALDCSGGKSCPGGMMCAALGAEMVCT